MLFLTLYAFLIIFVHKILYFMHFLQKRDIPMDRRTDTPSYRDARKHQKRPQNLLELYYIWWKMQTATSSSTTSIAGFAQFFHRERASYVVTVDVVLVATQFVPVSVQNLKDSNKS